MEIRTQDVEGTTLAEVVGTLDQASCDDFNKAVAELSSRKGAQVVLSLQEVPRVDSHGVRALLLLLKRVRAGHGVVVLCELAPQVLSAFEFAGLGSSFTIVPTRQKAARELALKVSQGASGEESLQVHAQSAPAVEAEDIVELTPAEQTALRLFQEMGSPSDEKSE